MFDLGLMMKNYAILSVLTASAILLTCLVKRISSSMVVYRDLIGYDIRIRPSAQYLNSFSCNQRLDCFSACSSNSKCQLVTYQSNQCLLYSISSVLCLIPSSSMNLSQKMINNNFESLRVFQNTDPYMTHYWPLVNGYDMVDMITGINLASPSPTWTTDRFGVNGSACQVDSSLNYLQAPSGYYMYPSFTFMFWFKLISCSQNARFLDMSNGVDTDAIFVFVTSSCSLGFATQNCYNTVGYTVPFGQWILMTITAVNNRIDNVYINGVAVGTGLCPYNSVISLNCFFGKSTYSVDPYLGNVYDEIKFYNRTLSQQEILAQQSIQTLLTYL